MRLLSIAATLLGLLPAHGDAEAFLRSVAIDDPLGFEWRVSLGGSYITREMRGWRIERVADKHTNATTSAEAEENRSPNNTVDGICRMLQSSASANDLPLSFLMRLTWQESRFDAYAVSRAGARGISQFMPGTAAWIGLRNPFEVSDAVRKSAELLRDLRKRFGNLGLAAAAYNAGPKRVQDWLANRRDLPAETQVYVRVVTGRTVDDWKSPQASGLSPIDGESMPCPQIAKVLAEQSARTVIADAQAATASVSLHEQAWGVQLLGNSSKVSVLAAYRQLQTRYEGVLGQRQPLVIPSKVGRTGYWYRVRVAVASFQDARKLCSSLRDLGGSCLVQHN
jgi:hypothetical protein